MGVQESNLADLSSAELDLGLDELTMLRWRFTTPESVPAKSEKTLACTWGSELLTRERVFSIRHRRAVSAKFAETAQKLPVTGICLYGRWRSCPMLQTVGSNHPGPCPRISAARIRPHGCISALYSTYHVCAVKANRQPFQLPNWASQP